MSETENKWAKKAFDHLVGRRIVSARYLTPEESADLGWSYRPVMVELDDGTRLFPSKDDEGNDAGALFGQTADGGDLSFPVMR